MISIKPKHLIVHLVSKYLGCAVLGTENMVMNKTETREFCSWGRWRVNKQLDKKGVRQTGRWIGNTWVGNS